MPSELAALTANFQVSFILDIHIMSHKLCQLSLGIKDETSSFLDHNPAQSGCGGRKEDWLGDLNHLIIDRNLEMKRGYVNSN